MRNISTNEEEELIFSDENVCVPGVSLIQKNRDTNEVYLSYSSPKTPTRVYKFNLLIKSTTCQRKEIPSGHNKDDYIVEELIQIS